VTRQAFGLTFPAGGTYHVSVVYVVPHFHEKLWKGPDGELHSNELVLAFRTPTVEEEEILDAYWAAGGLALKDEPELGGSNKEAPRRVISKYPNHPND
jgi:hypothetical protein